MNRWFRLYDDLVNDPKVQMLPDDLFKALINLWCIASKNGGSITSVENIAFWMRTTHNRVEEILCKLQAAGFLDEGEDGLVPHNWNVHQYQSDNSAERVKRHREKRVSAGLEGQWQAPKKLREEVYARDGYECVYCGATDNLTLDHKVSELRGGTHDKENLQTLCRPCNASKRDLTHDEYLARNAHVTALVTGKKRTRTENRTENRTEQKDVGANAPKRASQVPDDWQPKPEAISSLKAKGHSEAFITSQVERFRDYHQSKGNLLKDFEAGFRLWMSKAKEFARSTGPPAKQSEFVRAGLDLIEERRLKDAENERSAELFPSQTYLRIASRD